MALLRAPEMLLGVVLLSVSLSVVGPACSQQPPMEQRARIDTGSSGAIACPFTVGASAAAASEAMISRMPNDPNLRLTPLRAGTAVDSSRARQFILEMRRGLTRYRDVRVAEADGFRMWLRGVKLPVYHFTSWRRAIEALVRFDPARPPSLLYEKEPNGRFQLLGAMYGAPGNTTEDDLDALIPLSFARWHEHVNWCVPPPGAGSRWPETRAGEPIFGISTRTGCDSVGGQYRQRVGDWMVHVYAFASDDPRVIWCVEQHQTATGDSRSHSAGHGPSVGSAPVRPMSTLPRPAIGLTSSSTSP